MILNATLMTVLLAFALMFARPAFAEWVYSGGKRGDAQFASTSNRSKEDNATIKFTCQHTGPGGNRANHPYFILVSDYRTNWGHTLSQGLGFHLNYRVDAESSENAVVYTGSMPMATGGFSRTKSRSFFPIWLINQMLIGKSLSLLQINGIHNFTFALDGFRENFKKLAGDCPFKLYSLKEEF